MKLETIFSFQDLYQQMREAGFEGLEAKRLPVSEDRAPPEFCFDMMTGERLRDWLDCNDLNLRDSEEGAGQRALHIQRPAGPGPDHAGHGDRLSDQRDADHIRTEVSRQQHQEKVSIIQFFLFSEKWSKLT